MRHGEGETRRQGESPRLPVALFPHLRVSSLKKRGGHKDHPYQVSSEQFLVSCRELSDQCEQRQVHRDYD